MNCNRLKKIFFGGMAGIVILSFISKNSWAMEKFDYWGYVKSEISFHTTEPQDLMKFENTFQIKTAYHLIPGKVDIFARIMTYYDLIFDLESNVDDFWARKYKNDFYSDTEERILREFFIDYFSPNLDIRLGKQQVVWGEIDGFQLLDIVMPMDMREFVLDDFEDSRIPLWSIDIKWRFMPENPSNFLEFFWTPDVEPHDMPVDFLKLYKKWEFTPWLPPIFGLIQSKPWSSLVLDGPHHKKPAKSMENSDAAVRFVGQTLGGFSWTLNYLYTWDKMPTLFVDINPAIPLVSATAEHTRIHTVGASFNHAVGKWVTRGELAYYINKYQYSKDETLQPIIDKLEPLAKKLLGINIGTLPLKTVKKDYLTYCLGIERNFFVDMLVSAQLIQTIITNWNDNLLQMNGSPLDEVDNIITLMISQFFLADDQLKPQILVAYHDDGGWWIQPKVPWEVNDHLKLTIGANVFDGKYNDLLGQMSHTDQIFCEIKYSF